MSREKFKCISYWDFPESSFLFPSYRFVVLSSCLVGEGIYCKGTDIAIATTEGGKKKKRQKKSKRRAGNMSGQIIHSFIRQTSSHHSLVGNTGLEMGTGA